MKKKTNTNIVHLNEEINKKETEISRKRQRDDPNYIDIYIYIRNILDREARL